MYNKCIVIRQSAVLTTDITMPKKWREIFISEWLSEVSGETELWCSSFDHYSKTQRSTRLLNEVLFKIRIFKSPGYKKNISFLRILDAWIFSIKIFFKICLTVRRKDLVVCSIPTPESAFAVHIAKLLFGFTVIYDIRDNWVTIGNSNFLVRAFNKYNLMLLTSVIRSATGLTGFSQKYVDEHIKYCTIPSEYEVPKSLNFVSKSGLFENTGVSRSETSDFLFFGTLNKQFSFDVLKANQAEISKVFPNVRFYIYGDGYEFEKVKELFSDSKNVHVVGYQPFSLVAQHASTAAGFFCFYRDQKQFSGHITNKMVEFLEFGKPAINNFSINPVFNGNEVHLGPSLEKYTLVECVRMILLTPKNVALSHDLVSEGHNKSNFLTFVNQVKDRVN